MLRNFPKVMRQRKWVKSKLASELHGRVLPVTATEHDVRIIGV
jgi:hypothetical protein